MSKKRSTKHDNYTKEQLIVKLQKLEKQRYGLVWEDKPEDVAKQCETKLPVLAEVVIRFHTRRSRLMNSYLSQ